MKTYRVGNMDCANCAREVEVGVGKLDGVRRIEVDFATGKMTLDADVPVQALQARVEALGKTLEDDAGPMPAAADKRSGIIGFWDYLTARYETRLALAGGGMMLLTLLASANLPLLWVRVLYTAAMLITLYPVAKSGLNTLRINREFSINLLMTIAAVGAIFIGEYLEAAMVIFLFAIGEALEGYTADRARGSIRSLLSLKSQHAVRLTHGMEEVVGVDALQVGDEVLVKPGERVPVDGKILTGMSGVNQAPITGESIPVHKNVGDDVLAGSVNGEGTLTVCVTRVAEDSTLQRIIRMVEEAYATRAPTQRLVDRFAHYYTPSVVVMALLAIFGSVTMWMAVLADVGMSLVVTLNGMRPLRVKS